MREGEICWSHVGSGTSPTIFVRPVDSQDRKGSTSSFQQDGCRYRLQAIKQPTKAVVTANIASPGSAYGEGFPTPAPVSEVGSRDSYRRPHPRQPHQQAELPWGGHQEQGSKSLPPKIKGSPKGIRPSLHLVRVPILPSNCSGNHERRTTRRVTKNDDGDDDGESVQL